MISDRFRRLLPIAGMISALMLGAAIFATPSAPQIEKTNHAEVVSFYHDHVSSIMVTNLALALLAAFLFAALLTELRAALRSGEAGESIYSSLATIGGTVLIVGFAVMGMTTTAVAGAADVGLSDDSVLAVAMIADYAWMPWLLGSALTLLATGIGGLRTATMPAWFSWTSVALGGLCLTGLGGIAVFLVLPLWTLVVSILLFRKQSAEKADSRGTTQPVSA